MKKDILMGHLNPTDTLVFKNADEV